jgi:hypothetical protein
LDKEIDMKINTTHGGTIVGIVIAVLVLFLSCLLIIPLFIVLAVSMCALTIAVWPAHD